jgi:hypothetical protein
MRVRHAALEEAELERGESSAASKAVGRVAAMWSRSSVALGIAVFASVFAGCGSSSEVADTSATSADRKGPVSASVVENGIAGLRIGMTPQRVQGVLGPPNDTQMHEPHTTGAIDLTYTYDHDLKVDFLRDDTGRHTAYTISTTSDFFQTIDGVGVGSTRAEAERAAPHCVPMPSGNDVCTLGGVSFELRDDHVVRVSVFSPPF